MNPTLVIARAVDKMSLLTEIEHAIKRFKNDPTDHNEKEVALLFNLFMHKVAGERMGFDQANQWMKEFTLANEVIKRQTKSEEN